MTAAIERLAPDVVEDRQCEQQLAAARSRLVADLAEGGAAADIVTDSFERNSRRFADARVRSFVPILVERAVRAELADGRAARR
jgi:hypothetical protein